MDNITKLKQVQNQHKTFSEGLREVVAFRSLIATLAMREFKIRYAQTLLGYFWSVVPVLAYLAIYTLFFSVLMRVENYEVPYALLALTGILGWNLFREIASRGGQSLINDAHLMKKNYFPRLVLPLYQALTGIFEFCIAFFILIVIQLILRHPFQWTMVFLPLIVLLNIIVGLAVALWTCILSVRVRDFFHLVSSTLNFAFWLTPVFYTPEIMPGQLRFLFYCNPVAGVIELYRWALLGSEIPSPLYLIGITLGFIFFIFGLIRFIKVEDNLADYI